MLTARDPAFAFTAVSVALSKGTFAFAMAAFCSVASFKSPGIRDLFRLGDRPSVGIGDDLHGVVAFHRIDRQLQFSVLDLELGRDRRSSRLGACSAFTRVAACTLARSPIRDPLSEGFRHFRLLHACSGSFRLHPILASALPPL